MSPKRYKQIDNKEQISILFPSRNRPLYLQNLFDSLEETTQEKKLVDVWIFVDDDDLITKKFLDTQITNRKYNFQINYLIGDRGKSHGEMHNILRDKCTTNPGIYMMGGDKLLFVTKNWDRFVREAFNQYADRILFAYAIDPHHESLKWAAYGFLSAEWTNVTGRFFTEYFPFWFDDIWINQVALMIQRRIKLDVRLELQGGKGITQRMKNLLFWDRLFDNTLDERIEEADWLRKSIYSENSTAYQASVAEAEEFVKSLRKQIKERKEEESVYLEIDFGTSQNLNVKPDNNYLAVERKAVTHLKQKANSLLKQGRIIELMSVLNNILGAYDNLKDLEYKRIILQGEIRAIKNKLQRKFFGIFQGK